MVYGEPLPSLNRGFEIPGGFSLHLVQGVSMAFDPDRTLFVPISDEEERHQASLVGDGYIAIGGCYVYLSEQERTETSSSWSVDEAIYVPAGEDPATFITLMLDSVRPVILSAAGQGIDPSQLPDPRDEDGLRNIISAADLEGAFCLGGVSAVVTAEDDEFAFGVLHVPHFYNLFDASKTVEATTRYLAARAVLFGR